MNDLGSKTFKQKVCHFLLMSLLVVFGLGAVLERGRPNPLLRFQEKDASKETRLPAHSIDPLILQIISAKQNDSGKSNAALKSDSK